MTSRVSNNNEEAKRKNSVKKKTDQTETENSVAGSRTWFICTFKQLLDHCTIVTYTI